MNENGRVLGPEEGELLHLRGPSRKGQVIIKVDPAGVGEVPFSMGTQRLEPGSRIPVHRHAEQEEIFFIHQGEGAALLGEERHPVVAGATVYIPRGVWHGIENSGAAPMELVWIISPPGLEAMFREIGAPPGTAVAPLLDDEFSAVVRRHRMEIRPDASQSAGPEAPDS